MAKFSLFLVALSGLGVGATQTAFAQTPDDQTQRVDVVIPKGGTVSEACHDHGVTKSNLRWCWTHARGPDGKVLANPDFVIAGTTISIERPLAVVNRALAVPQQTVSDDDVRNAISQSNYWENQHRVVEEQLRASEAARETAEQQLSELRLAQIPQGMKLGANETINETQRALLDELAKQGTVATLPGGGYRKLSDDELRKKFGVVLQMDPNVTTADTGTDSSDPRVQELEREVAEFKKNDEWQWPFIGAAIIVIGFLIYALKSSGNRDLKKEAEAAAKPAKEKKPKADKNSKWAWGTGKAKAAPTHVSPQIHPEPARLSGDGLATEVVETSVEDEVVAHAPAAPAQTESSEVPLSQPQAAEEAVAAEVPQPIAEPTATVEVVQEALPPAPPPPGLQSPARMFNTSPEEVVESQPLASPAPAVPPLRVVIDDPDIKGPDKDGYYTGVWKRLIVKKYVKGGETVIVEAVIRFKDSDVADFMRPDGSWHSYTPKAFAHDVLNEVGFHVEGKFAFDDKKLTEDAVDQNPELVLEKRLPSREDVLKFIPEKMSA